MPVFLPIERLSVRRKSALAEKLLKFSCDSADCWFLELTYQSWKTAYMDALLGITTKTQLNKNTFVDGFH
ncbi:hypothetical protein RsTz2092_12010 [Deferribacterales bacterium RsTz2092]